MTTKYEELFPEEFKKRLTEKPIAYLPLGSLEYHGYHNVLGLDSLKAWKICQLAAEKFGGIVFPPLYLGVDTWPDIDLQKYPNKQFDCYHLDKETYQQILESYFYRMFRIGFQKIFVLAGHYPDADIATEAAKKYTNEGKQAFVFTEASLLREPGDHAGKWETSLMMELFPELVNMKRMEGKDDPLLAIDGIDPRESSREFGREAIGKILKAIEEKLLA